MTDQPRQDLEVHKNYKIFGGVSDSFLGKTVEWGVVTNGGPEADVNSTFLCSDGDRVETTSKTSTEVTGVGKVGTRCQPGEPSKVIIAQSGDIVLDAKNGDVIIKARNIRIVAEDGSGEITLRSGKIVEINAPVSNIKGTNVNVTATSKVTQLGQFVEGAAGVQNSSATLTDATQGSFIGAALGVISNLKKFLQLL